MSSLTLGGYDSSRFVPNDLTLNFASDNERDLVVAIQKIGTDTTTDSLLPNAVYAYVDSTVSQIWLPLEACQAFEKAFGLKYDNDTQLYLVNSDLHDSLTKSNPNVTFTLGQGLTGGTTVDVTLPYAAFDMQATPPYQGLIAQSYYFPLRRAANDTQYTLGRAFLQEAYLFVDWERETFNISQCAWTEGMTEHIVPVRSVNDTSGDSSGSPSGMTNVSSGNSGIGTGAIIGIAVGIGAVVALLGIGLFFCWRRRKRNAKRSHDQHEKLESPDLPNSTQVSNNITRERSRENLNAGNEGLVIPKAELDATQTSRGKEPIARNSMAKSGDPSSPTDGEGTLTSNGSRASMLHEADSKPREIFEMMGDMPIRQEAGGRALSEKETMMVREARYNGFNPTSTSPSTPTSPPPFPTPIATGAPGTPRADTSGHPSPMTPGNDAKDYLSVHPSAGTRIGPPPPPRRRQLVSPGEVIELSPFERDNVTQNLVSPISGPGGGSSDGHGTNVFSPLSPGGAGTGTMSSGDATVVGEGNSPVSERNRRRFSYE